MNPCQKVVTDKMIDRALAQLPLGTERRDAMLALVAGLNAADEIPVGHALAATLIAAKGLIGWAQGIAKGENQTYLRLASTLDLDERYAMAEALRHEAIDALSSLDPDGEGCAALAEVSP